MSKVYLFALANLALCMAIVFVAICRLNAMDPKYRVLFRVRAEYALYIGGAFASGFQPLWNEWPEYGTLAIGAALFCGLLASSQAWHGDKPPASATGPAPLGPD